MTRVAVVGVGAMGRHHARIYRELPNAKLLAVSDVDLDTACRVADFHNVRGYSNHIQMIETERPEAVSIAVPTAHHYRVVMDALERGCHVLVEKPIAETLEEAQRLANLAETERCILMVGHVERFNSAVVDLKRRLDAGDLGRLFQVHARRLGPFPSRVQDVGVAVDLATHDIDIMRHLSGSHPERVYAETRREVHATREDLINGLVRFRDGMLGLLEISWLTPTKIRELSVTGEKGMFKVDYLTQDLYFFENAGASDDRWEPLSLLRGGVNEGAMTRFALHKREPLRTELEVFLAAVEGDASDVVTARDGLLALQVAVALIQSAEKHQVVNVD